MKYWNKICGLFLGFLLTSLLSTAQTQIKSINTHYTSSSDSLLQIKRAFLGAPYYRNANILHTIIPANYYTTHFGFMCKQELALEKATKLPLRFRLGTLEECNRMEGKR